MSLDYLSLALLVAVVVIVFYGLIAIHDIPHVIAKHRNHPHQDAIGAAAWVSLFMLGALWPLLWIWAMAYRPERGWGFESRNGASLASIQERLCALERAERNRASP